MADALDLSTVWAYLLLGVVVVVAVVSGAIYTFGPYADARVHAHEGNPAGWF